MHTVPSHSMRKSLLLVLFVTAALLLVPLVAMQFTVEVKWTPLDFAVAGGLLFGAGMAYVLIARSTHHVAGRMAACIAVAAALMLAWVNLAVGIIGSENNPANLMYAGVFAIEALGIVVARRRPGGMAYALLATALGQAAVTVIALVGGLGASQPPGRFGIFVLNGFFVALFAAAAWLFRRAARAQPRAAPPDPVP